MLLLLACVSDPDIPMRGEEPDEPGTPHLGAVELIEGERWFSAEVIHQIDIELPAPSLLGLATDPYSYVEGAVTIGDRRLSPVGVRLRGKYGSFRTLDGKPKFKIDLNRYDPSLSYAGLEQLALNNEVVDCSHQREPLGYAVFAALDLPAPRTAYTRVSVNGEHYGLYVIVEFPDDVFLGDHYDDGSGNLYDGKYLYEWPSGDYALVDFTSELVGNFVLEEGEDVGGADVGAVAEAAEAGGLVAENLAAVVDMERFHRHIVAEELIGHVDGYALNTNNYRVYFDPDDGLADLLTYDLDYAFYEDSSWGMSWSRPRGILARRCWQDPGCVSRHAEVVAEALDQLDSEAFIEQLDAWTALIADDLEDDPRNECRPRSVGANQRELKEWMEETEERVRDHWR